MEELQGKSSTKMTMEKTYTKLLRWCYLCFKYKNGYSLFGTLRDADVTCLPRTTHNVIRFDARQIARRRSQEATLASKRRHGGGQDEKPMLPAACLRRRLETKLSSFVLLLTVLLATPMFNGRALVPMTEVFSSGLPSGIARGGKGAKGAGGGATRYGFRGVHNAAAYEMTWEDIVLAMQLSAMCFGALIALCIVTCCAYKICGPAEEEDYRSYRPAFRQPRLPPELYREIYTLPGAGQEKPAAENVEAAQGSLTPHVAGGGGGEDPSGGLVNGRGSRIAGGRLVGGTGRAGVAPRLAQHLHNSSLDLTCPPGGVPSDRAMSEPRQNPV